jgi:hypothetical protein
MGLSSSGNQVRFGGIWIHRLEDGRTVEGCEWGAIDWMSLLYQMGAAIGLFGHLRLIRKHENEQRLWYFGGLYTPKYQSHVPFFSMVEQLHYFYDFIQLQNGFLSHNFAAFNIFLMTRYDTV